MSQDILVFLIVFATIGYVAYSLVISLIRKKSDNACGGCTGCSLSEKRASIPMNKININ
ncbi:MAG: FeoB-associated Cys-rich membrane protein [Melioribacteraceae bacterium]|nr:FeoB-associated Cys-rich membrane protein [Melioribacteraceae bacterium]